MKKISYILIACMLALPLRMQALTPAKVAHIDADFTQTRHSAMLNTDQVMTGTFSFDAPNTIVWKYDDGIEAQLPKEMLLFISKAVSGEYISDNAEFTVTIDGNTAILVPKRRQIKQFFRQIEIEFDLSVGVAQKVILYEALDDVTTIVFRNIHTR